ncbi:hypothetical protein [Mesorhizobium sp. M1406]|uniref:hypothetical protein n=1 Tax=Mesorhizobium sp. M1406 TaxID=2957099 RepID=UPI0033399C06
MGWTIEQWIAIATIAGSAFGWAIANVVRAWTYSREQQQREWARFGEILGILNNKNYEHGMWAQLAAINELRSLRTKRPLVLRIAREARTFWADGGNVAVLAELDELIRDLER